MAFRPFKPPATRTQQNRASPDFRTTTLPTVVQEPPAKKRRLSPESQGSAAVTPSTTHEDIENHRTKNHRTPLSTIQNDVSGEQSKDRLDDDGGVYYAALWRKFTLKKNKTWDDDGFLSLKHGQLTLFDSRAKSMGQTTCAKPPTVGDLLSVAGKEVEVGDAIGRKEFCVATGIINGDTKSRSTQPFAGMYEKPALSMREQMKQQMAHAKKAGPVTRPSIVNPSRSYIPFKQPLKEDNVLPQVPSEMPIPRHDPHAAGAVVFRRPKKAPSGRQIVDVVLDPMLSKQLREHQKEGVKFMYECVMGMRNYGGQGCILADDMGLGKTLQTIALLWTLIKQNPIYKTEPVVKKALIVCPVTLIQNWKKEFKKWLGNDRLGVLTFGDDKHHRLRMFDGKNFKVMIIGYEKLRTVAEDLTRGAGIDIVVCDEGHRLKTLKNKSAQSIDTLNTAKRIILSGTPIQNDLSEFFAMANFINDGILGTYKSFVRAFENPITKSRQPNATEKEIEKGEYASEELTQTTTPFILRRTVDILANYLPPKTEYVLFCDPTPEQARLYREVVNSPMFRGAVGSHDSALQLITILKKLCNSPALMRPESGSDESTSTTSLAALNEMLPGGSARLYSNRFSSKIRLLDELLHQIRTTTQDKIILVSNYTSTLNLVGQLLDSTGGRYLRLDGTVPQKKRQALVDEFNSSPSSSCFAFLLSAKAGGVGLNLVGANRLVLFDVDWNPATDDQAMGRIYRQGQKKHCKIYRFIIKGSLEERIWQRQVVKRGLADSIMEGGTRRGNSLDSSGKDKKNKAAFSLEELKDLFRLDERTGLQTHDLIGCKCTGNGEPSLDQLEGIPDDERSDISDELPDTSSLIKASKLSDASMEAQERMIAQGRHLNQAHFRDETDQGTHELMQYAHLDTATLPDLYKASDEDLTSMESAVDDDCLMTVLKLDHDTIAGRVAHIFKKMVGPKAESV